MSNGDEAFRIHPSTIRTGEDFIKAIRGIAAFLFEKLEIDASQWRIEPANEPHGHFVVTNKNYLIDYPAQEIRCRVSCIYEGHEIVFPVEVNWLGGAWKEPLVTFAGTLVHRPSDTSKRQPWEPDTTFDHAAAYESARRALKELAAAKRRARS